MINYSFYAISEVEETARVAARYVRDAQLKDNKKKGKILMFRQNNIPHLILHNILLIVWLYWASPKMYLRLKKCYFKLQFKINN